MSKKLIKLGRSYAVILDKAFLNQLKIGPDTQVEVLLDNKDQCIRICRSSYLQELYEAARKKAQARTEEKAFAEFMGKAAKVLGKK